MKKPKKNSEVVRYILKVGRSGGICTYYTLLGLGQKTEIVYLVGRIEECTLDYTCCLGQGQLLTTHGSLEHLEGKRG